MQRMLARRALIAVSVTLGLLALSAGPASAGAPASFVGDITVGAEVFPVDSTQTPPAGECAGTRSIDATFTSTSATAGTWVLDGFFKSPFQLSGSATWYQAEIDILSSSVGTYAQVSPGVWALSGRIDAQAVIQSLGAYPTCGKTNLCTVRTRMILDPSASIHTGTLPTPTAGDTTTLVASSNPAPPGVRVTVIGSACPVTISAALVNQHAGMDITATW